MKNIAYLLRWFTVPAYRIQGWGLGRLCDFIRRVFATYSFGTQLVIRDFQGTGVFACHLDEHMGSQIFFKGSYSTDLLTLLQKTLPSNGVFIDIGANHGELTIAAALLMPCGRVISIEPLEKNILRLKSNIALNRLTNVEIMPVGVSDTPGIFPYFDHAGAFSDGTHNEGLSSLYPSDSRRSIGGSIQIKRLDDLIAPLKLERIDLIKLDIEGAEWPALRGALTTLTHYRPTLIVEVGKSTCQAAGYRAEAFVEWLQSLGYVLSRINGGASLTPIGSTSLGDFQNLLAIPHA